MDPDKRTSAAAIAAAKKGRPAHGKAPEGAALARAVTELTGRRLAERTIEENAPKAGEQS